jgi:hypothetical protein
MDTKNCPYCGEEVLIEAKKCKHCKEWLTEQPETEVQEVYNTVQYPWLISLICYAAMLFEITSCLQDLGAEGGIGKTGFFVWVSQLIPEYLNILISGTLWIIILCSLRNKYPNVKGYFIAWAVLEGLGTIIYLSSLVYGSDLEIIELIFAVFYLIMLFILGIKIIKSIGWAIIVNTIGVCIVYILMAVYEDAWWTILAGCFLNVFLLYVLNIQILEDIKEESESEE